MLLTVIKWFVGRVAMLAAVFLLVLVFGELIMRAGLVLPVMQYDKSNPTVAFALPNQRAVMYVANHTYRCPPLTMNSDGIRGPEIDWSKKVILLLGSSETMGTGVHDDEVCSSVLDRQMQLAEPNKFTVVNAALPGFGPYHQTVMLEKVLVKHNLHAVIVRVTMADCQFLPKRIADRGQLVSWLRNNTRLFSTLARKAASQYGLMRKVRFALHRTQPIPAHVGYSEEFGKYRFLQHREHWERMIDLCSTHGVPLVFVVVNPQGFNSEKILNRGLAMLASGQGNILVAEMGAAVFGLDSTDTEDRPAAYLNRWTLRCDPHANAAQHELFGDTVMKILVAVKLIVPSAVP